MVKFHGYSVHNTACGPWPVPHHDQHCQHDEHQSDDGNQGQRHENDLYLGSHTSEQTELSARTGSTTAFVGIACAQVLRVAALWVLTPRHVLEAW